MDGHPWGRIPAWIGFTSLVLSAFLAGNPAPASAGQTSLKVLTLNVKGLPKPLANNNGRYKEIGRRIREHRKAGSAPQIIVFQEAFSKSAVNDLLKESQYPFAVKGGGGSFLKLSSGLLIISEYPILSARMLKFDDCVSWDCFSKKGALGVSVEVPGLAYPVEVLTTHFNSDPNSDPFTSRQKTEAVRLKQIEQYSNWFRPIRDNGSLFIAAGDYNFYVRRRDYEAFRDQIGLTDAVDYCHLSGCRGMLERGPDVMFERSVDHQFYGSTVTGASITPTHFDRTFGEPYKNKPVTDHLGLEVTYVIDDGWSS